MWIYTYACIYIYTYTIPYIYTYAYIYINICAYIFIYTYMEMYVIGLPLRCRFWSDHASFRDEDVGRWPPIRRTWKRRTELDLAFSNVTFSMIEARIENHPS